MVMTLTLVLIMTGRCTWYLPVLCLDSRCFIAVACSRLRIHLQPLCMSWFGAELPCVRPTCITSLCSNNNNNNYDSVLVLSSWPKSILREFTRFI